jgi:hypothetical protein
MYVLRPPVQLLSKNRHALIIGGLANPAWKVEVEGIAVA